MHGQEVEKTSLSLKAFVEQLDAALPEAVIIKDEFLPHGGGMKCEGKNQVSKPVGWFK